MQFVLRTTFSSGTTSRNLARTSPLSMKELWHDPISRLNSALGQIVRREESPSRQSRLPTSPRIHTVTNT